MRTTSVRLVGLFFFLLTIVGCASMTGDAPRQVASLKPTVLLVSIDGFRWDYLEKYEAPRLKQLAAEGTRIKHFVPIFPSVTFPNHYTMVTGLYAEHHGIVANEMFDPITKKRFVIQRPECVEESEWWEGEPIWVTAEKQNQKSASMYWVGSAAEIAGRRPSYWFHYDGTLARSKRVAQVLKWLDLPEKDRPTFITLYFEDVDRAGHEGGPDSDGVRKAVLAVDESVGELFEGLKKRGVENQINLIVVSDHGMIYIDPAKALPIDKFIDVKDLDILGKGPYLGIIPPPGKEQAVYRKLQGAHPHFKVYRKDEMPERFHLRHHRRVQPLYVMADEGWYLMSSSEAPKPQLGQHGYDNLLPSMHGFFVARGPAFKKGLVVESMESIHLYELMTHLLHLKPAPNDGSLTKALSALKIAPLMANPDK